MKVLIIEDELAAVNRLQKLLVEIEMEVEVITSLPTVSESIEWLKENQAPDLIFMDIQLADGSSFEIFEKVSIPAPVIFTTAYDEFAIKAFKVKAIDYLLKPVKLIDLKNAVEHFALSKRSVVDHALEEKLSDSGLIKKPKRILVKSGTQMKLIELDQMSYFFSRDKITYAVPHGQRKVAIDQSLDQIENWSDPSQYFRISRQYIISLKSISEMSVNTQSRIKLKLDPDIEDEILVSKDKAAEFRKWLLGEEQ